MKCLHAITGTEGVHTLSLTGRKGHKKLTMLVDSGSTHNFMSLTTAKSLGITPEPCLPFKVTVADGSKLVCNQQARKVKWEMAGETFVADMMILPIGGYDLILGVNWMKKVSPVMLDFETNTISVKWKGKKMDLKQVDGGPTVKLVSNSKKSNWFHKDDTCYLVQVMTTNAEKGTIDIPEEIKPILQEYQDVFNEPRGLPPKRTQDHRIPL